MEEVVGLLKQIAPEIANLVENRYTILRSIYFNQPIGRRALSSIISWSERQLRAEVKRLEEQGLLTIDQQGMKLTDAGKDMIFKMEHFIYHLRGLNPIAQKIRQRFNCGYVSIVPGNTDEDETIKLQLGKEAARYIKKTINDGDIVEIGRAHV